MVQIAWLQCPDCDGKFYVEKPQLGKNADWVCPFCKRKMKESEAKEIIQ